MQLLAPLMMIGATAVSIPVALHFFYRARYKPLPWAPMKFLKEAIEQTSRRLKFQEWILLALRCLAILVLATAFARPGCETAKLSNRGDAVDAVLVIDTSYSMGARDGGKTRLDRAKDAAKAVIETLPPNSSVQVFTCSDRAALVGPIQKFNLDQARQLIDNVQLTSLSSDLLPGLTEAHASATAGTAPAKEVYVFTDMQKEAFERQQGAVKAKCEEIKAAGNLVFVRCGNPATKVPNVTVENVSWHTDIPHTRTRVPFVITLRNTGTEPVKALKVSLEIDGKAVEKDATQVDQIDPGQTQPVTLTGSLDSAGVRVASVRVEGDDLPGDDVLFRTILVRDKVRVLLVDGTPHPDNPTESGDHFVKTALNPSRTADYYIEAESVPASEVGTRDLIDTDIVYLLNAPVRGADPLAGMSNEFLDELAKFVRRGGGLVIGCGDNVDPAAYNRTLGAAGFGLLPFDMREVRNATEASPFVPAPESVADPSFLRPADPGRKELISHGLRGVRLTRMIDLADAGAGQVLVRTTENRPYIASKVVGEGEVVLITSSLDESWGTFSSDPGSFHVPLSRLTVTHLTGRKVPGGTVAAGTPLVWSPPREAGDAFELVLPPLPGERIRPRVKLAVTESNGRRTVTTTETQRAGLYHIVPLGKADDAGPLFAVNPDLREAEKPAVARDEDLETLLGYRPPVVPAGADTQSAVADLRTRSEWTEWFLLVLLLLLVGEAAWAWLCGRAW